MNSLAMTTSTNRFLCMVALWMGLFLLSSFALLPSPPVKNTTPPTKTQRSKQRLVRLEQRLQQAPLNNVPRLEARILTATARSKR